MNELKHLEEFRKVLDNYKVSDAGKQLLQDVELVLLAAPTSSGRNTIIRKLLKTDKYHYIVSDTTRRPRINDGQLEQDGVQYWFRKEEETMDDLRGGKFLEAAIIHNQQVSGISLRELEVARSQHKVAITDIEMAGVETIVEAKPDTIVIFVVPPSFEVWQERISGRGSMDPNEYRRRLTSSLQEFKHALDKPYYHFVINDNLYHAVEQIDVAAKHADVGRESELANRKLVEELCRATEKHLKTM